MSFGERLCSRDALCSFVGGEGEWEGVILVPFFVEFLLEWRGDGEGDGDDGGDGDGGGADDGAAADSTADDNDGDDDGGAEVAMAVEAAWVGLSPALFTPGVSLSPS